MRLFRDYNIIFFDLDGTLSDSKEGIIRCLQYSLSKFGIQEDDEEKLTQCIGPSLAFTYTEWYGLTHEEARQATNFYRDRFERKGIYENSLYEGVAELLIDLHAAGKRLVLATAKPMVHAKEILKHHGIAEYFTVIAGSNLDGTREHKEEVIAFALEQLGGICGNKIVMVGDRKHDILGAHENNLPSIGVCYGYGAKEEIEQAMPEAIACSIEELRNLLL